jgi:hypothetical protein
MTPEQWLPYVVCGSIALAFVAFIATLKNAGSSGKLKPQVIKTPGGNVSYYGGGGCSTEDLHAEENIITHERDRLFGSRGEMYRNLSKHAIDSLYEDPLMGAGPVENTVIEGYYTEGR